MRMGDLHEFGGGHWTREPARFRGGSPMRRDAAHSKRFARRIVGWRSSQQFMENR
jgi:hypothetical protein